MQHLICTYTKNYSFLSEVHLYELYRYSIKETYVFLKTLFIYLSEKERE